MLQTETQLALHGTDAEAGSFCTWKPCFVRHKQGGEWCNQSSSNCKSCGTATKGTWCNKQGSHIYETLSPDGCCKNPNDWIRGKGGDEGYDFMSCKKLCDEEESCRGFSGDGLSDKGSCRIYKYCAETATDACGNTKTWASFSKPGGKKPLCDCIGSTWVISWIFGRCIESDIRYSIQGWGGGVVGWWGSRVVG